MPLYIMHMYIYLCLHTYGPWPRRHTCIAYPQFPSKVYVFNTLINFTNKLMSIWYKITNIKKRSALVKLCNTRTAHLKMTSFQLQSCSASHAGTHSNLYHKVSRVSVLTSVFSIVVLHLHAIVWDHPLSTWLFQQLYFLSLGKRTCSS